MRNIAEKLSKIRIPWIPGLHKPNFKLSIPTIDLADPSVRQVIFVILVVFSSLMSAGIIFMLVNPPPALITIYSKKPTILLPDIDRQTLTEGIVVFSLFIISMIGIFIMRRSTEVFTEEEARSLWLSFGFALLLIGSLALAYILNTKIEEMKKLGRMLLLIVESLF